MGWRAAALTAVLVGGVVGCRGSGLEPEGEADSGSGSGSTWEVFNPHWGPLQVQYASYVRKAAPNPIPGENQLPGDPAWQSGREAWDHQVELYASADSAEAGDTIAVRVSTDQASSVTAKIYRLGYYGGAGARAVWTGGPYATFTQATCPRDATTGLVECHWTDTFSFQVGPNWVSGVYLVKVIRSDNFRAFTQFVVRDHRAAEILFQRSINTDEAYNAWGGESLYSDASHTVPGGFATAVSFDRPFQADLGMGLVDRWELWLFRFLEANGYDVTYGTNVDVSRFAGFMDGVGAYVAGGHDEYWDQQERDQMDAELASGEMSYAYFGANGAYWKTRYAPNSSGEPFRTLICYKLQPQLDPAGAYATKRYRDDPNAQPENELYGVMYSDWVLMPFSLSVSDPTHWIFDGTQLKAGEQLYGLSGYEYDRRWPQIGQEPAGLRVSFTTPMVSAEGVPDLAQTADYDLPSGTIVFAAGSIYWPLGLSSDPTTHDPRVERMTLNVIERALAHVRPMRTLPPVSGALPSQGPTQAVWARTVANFAGTPGPAASVDGPAATARFNGPTGVAVMSSLQVAVADAGGNQIRLIDIDSQRTVRTIAGNGALGLRNGPGAQAMFRRPTAVVQASDGSLLVADSDNHCIRQIANDGVWTVSVYAGSSSRQAGNADGPATTARFNRPTALALDSAGNLYVADQVNSRIRMVAAGTHVVSTIAGSSTGYLDSATGTQAMFNNPSAIALGPAGQIYVFDAGNQALRVIAPTGTRAVTTLAGNPGGAAGSVGYADGPGTTAQFRAQMGLAVGSMGEVMLGDTANYRIRKIIAGTDAASTNVYTIAGNGQLGTALGSGDVSNIVAPAGLTYAPTGQILVADSFNNVIRIITR